MTRRKYWRLDPAFVAAVRALDDEAIEALACKVRLERRRDPHVTRHRAAIAVKTSGERLCVTERDRARFAQLAEAIGYTGAVIGEEVAQ